MWRCRNRHVVLALLPFATQIRYPRPSTCTRIRIRIHTCTGGRAIHAAAPAALGRRVLPRRGRRCRAFGRRIGDVKVVFMALSVARLVRPFLYLIRLIGGVIKRTDRIPFPVLFVSCGAGVLLCFSRSFAGSSSTTTKLFWRSRSFHLSVCEMAWN